jgi:hypothetical protein
MQTHRTPTLAKRNPQVTEKNSNDTAAAATGKKFMLTLRASVFDELRRMADQRGVTIQGLIRAVIVPEWHLEHPNLYGENEKDEPDPTPRDRIVSPSTPILAWPRTRNQLENTDSRKTVGHN